MRKALVISAMALLPAVVAVGEPAAGADRVASRRSDPRARALAERMPLAFEANRGQAPEVWDFLVRCRGYHAFVRADGITFSMDGAPLALTFADASPCAPDTSGLEADGRVHYLVGNDPSKWLKDVATTRGAAYRDAIPGAAWSVGGRDRRVEFTFDVEPGAPLPRMRFDGGAVPRVTDEGVLRVEMPDGIADVSRPVAWQDLAAGRVACAAAWRVASDGTVTIDATRADPAAVLHVDPTVTYGTYLGGNADEIMVRSAMDAAGNVFISGNTYSTSFPTTSGAFSTALQNPTKSLPDLYVTKLNAAGTAMLWSTYLGGSNNDGVPDIAIDSSGRAVVGGSTVSVDFPTTPGAYKGTAPGQFGGCYLTKLDVSGSALVWSTYIGTGVAGSEVGRFALGPADEPYYVDSLGVAKLAADGTSRLWHARVLPLPYQYGTNGLPMDLCIDSSSNVYVCGDGGSEILAISPGAYQAKRASEYDVFLMKFDPSGAQVWGTLFGGTDTDYAATVAVNTAAQPYLLMNTLSAGLPATADAVQSLRPGATAGDPDCYVVRFNASGTGIRYASYLGGANRDYGTAIAVHPTGAFAVTGITDSTSATFPLLDAVHTSHPVGLGPDAFVASFDRHNLLTFSTFLGAGNVYLTGSRIAIGANGALAVPLTHYANATIPTYGTPLQASGAGARDAYVIGFPGSLSVPAPLQLLDSGVAQTTVTRPLAFSLLPTGGIQPYALTLVAAQFPAGVSYDAATATVSGTPTTVGNFQVQVRLSDDQEVVVDRTVTVIVSPLPEPEYGLATTTQGVALTRKIRVKGGTGPFELSVVAGQLPPGTTLHADGVLDGTPTVPGRYEFTVGIGDLRGATNTGPVAILVNPAPSILTTSVSDLTTTASFRYEFAAIDGTPPYAWSHVSGSLPTATTVDAASGVLIGMAREPKTYTFKVRVTDSVGAFAEATYSVAVHSSPQITTLVLAPAAVGRAYSFPLAVVGGTPAYSWFADGPAVTSGLGLSRTDGRLFGEPAVSGRQSMVVVCRDAWDVEATTSLLLDIGSAVDLAARRSKETLDLAEVADATVVRFVELTEGAVFGLKLKGGFQGGGAPRLEFTDASGAAVDVARWRKASKSSITVKGFPVPATGRYFIAATPVSGAKGSMTLSFSVAARAAWTDASELSSSATSEFTFAAPPGALVSITAKAAKGSAALPRFVSLTGADAVDLVPGGTTKESRSTATFASKVPLAGGDCTVTLATRDGSAGPVTWTVKLKLPKTYDFTLPDLPAGE